MRKQVYGRKFKRDKNERKALFQGLISAIILEGRIETTLEKAKAIQPDLEKLVTKAKKGETSKLELKKSLKPFEMDIMINDIAPRFKTRAGGYTRIIKTGKRFNDNASTAILEWVEGPIIKEPEVKKVTKKNTEKAVKNESKAEKKPAIKRLSLRKPKEEKESK